VLNDNVLILKDVIDPNGTAINAMDPSIFTSLGVSLSPITNLAGSVGPAVTTVVNNVITAEIDMATSADLYGFYEHITDGSVGGFGAAKYLTGVSVLYGAYNEW